jgi:hypothetical protein
MKIPVMLIDGGERSVSKDELQFLLSANQVLCFERSSGTVFIGYDRVRGLAPPYTGEDRRNEGSLLAS